MDKQPRHRVIDVFIFDGVNLLDVAGPVQALETALYNGTKVYSHRYVSLDGGPVKASSGLVMTADAALSANSPADDLLIPGGDVDPLLDNDLLRDVIAQRALRDGDGRLISVCSGALILAAAGVLDGQIATTHWSRDALTGQFDKVLWDLDRISTQSDRIFTSAGVTTGIDLALAMIRTDCGNAVALEVARELVVQLRRTGGQSQYAMHLAGQFTPDDSLAQLIEAVVARPDRLWSLDSLAQTAGMNARTLSRRFKSHLDLSPAQFVERTRVDHARGLLAEGIPLQTAAVKSGFGDLQRMRRAFQRRFGINLGEYLAAFGNAS